MSDYNTAALADYERHIDQGDKLWNLYAAQARSNLLERMLDERPHELLDLIEDYGITWLQRRSEPSAHERDRRILIDAINKRDDCDFGGSIIDAACQLWVETLDESVIWDEIRALDGR